MKKALITILVFSFGLFSCNILAANNKPPMNTVSMRLNAQGWAKTTTAKIIIAVNATQTNQDVSKMRGMILEKLNQIAKAPWKITTFMRTQDQSGLEKIYLQAQVRLPNAQLSNLRTRVQKVSQAGLKFSIVNMDFNPSLAEIELARGKVRQLIYADVKKELASLNTQYPKQHFVLHSINFSGSPSVVPMVLSRQATGMARPMMRVTQHIILTAQVVLASKD